MSRKTTKMFREAITLLFVLVVTMIGSSEAGFIDDSDKSTVIVSPEVTPIYLKEGDNLTMTCHQKESKEVEWFADTTKIDSSTNTGILITNDNEIINGVRTTVSTLSKNDVTRADSSIYACKPKGEATKGYNVKVEVFKMEGIDAIVNEEDRSATIGCIVTGVSSYKPINWLRHGEKVQLDNEKYHKDDTNQTLEISNIKASDLGVYECSITLNNKMTFKTDVKVKGKPEVEDLGKSKNTVHGDKLTLHCKARGDPVPTIEWRFKNKTIDLTDSRISFSDYKNKDKKTLENATLIIENLKDEDAGNYSCYATNKHGTDSSHILLRVKDKLAALWPFLGIVTEVTILCIIIFVYERKRAKKMEEEDSAEEASHLANSNDHKGKDEIRQRK